MLRAGTHKTGGAAGAGGLEGRRKGQKIKGCHSVDVKSARGQRRSNCAL